MSTRNLPLDQNTHAKTWRALGVSVIGVAVLSMAMTRIPSPAVASLDCTVTIDDAIPIGPEQATVLAKFSVAIGDTLTVTFPEAANVVVISAKRGKDDGPLTATVVLTTLRATAGQWLVTVRGEKGVCTGRVWIGKGEPKKNGQ